MLKSHLLLMGALCQVSGKPDPCQPAGVNTLQLQMLTGKGLPSEERSPQPVFQAVTDS